MIKEIKLNKSNNKTVRLGYGLVYLLLLPITIPILFRFDSDFLKNTFLLLLPSFVYYLYIRFIVKSYYVKKANRIIASLEKKVIVIDEMLSYQVDWVEFKKERHSVLEYYFIIYNKEHHKYIRISSVKRMPIYSDEFIPDWKGNILTIYVNPDDWENPNKGIKPIKGEQKSYTTSPPPDFISDKNTLRVFKFNMGNYNLDDNYEYSINENIVKNENMFVQYVWTIPFFIFCYSLFTILL